MAYHLVLIHGTGARGAPWTREHTSGLCAHLKAVLGEPPSFSHSDWSGKNTHLARAEGARALLEHLRREVPIDRSLVLVGHSHGGSVIARALVQDAELCRRVAGVVFLSTPFLQARLLPLSRHLPKAIAFLAGYASAVAVILAVVVTLATATDWPRNSSPWLNSVVMVGVFSSLITWGVVFDRVAQWLGAGDGRLTDEEDRAVATLVEQLDLAVLNEREVTARSLLLRSTADEAAGGLATAQLLGRIASDLPALTWKFPKWLGLKLLAKFRLRNGEPSRWAKAAFVAWICVSFVVLCVAFAAWLLPDWNLLQAVHQALADLSDRAIGAGTRTLIWTINTVVFVLLASSLLTIFGAPLKLLSLFAYGLRGWPLLRAMFVELSVEPAPPGSWHLHQLAAGGFESAANPPGAATESRMPAIGETVLAHSYVYDDARAHRVIARWLSGGCRSGTALTELPMQVEEPASDVPHDRQPS